MTNSIRWILHGYLDRLDKTPYKRSPSPDPPKVPDSHLTDEWRLYFEGWDGAGKDIVRAIKGE